MKWPSLCRRHFQMHFLEWTCMHLDKDFTGVLFLMVHPNVGLDNWHPPGDKSLSEPMMVNLLTFIYVTWPQWVKPVGLWWRHFVSQNWENIALCNGFLSPGGIEQLTERMSAEWHRNGSKLAQVMTCCLTVSSHYLILCWLIISKLLWYSPESNFTLGISLNVFILDMFWKLFIWYYGHIAHVVQCVK